MNRNRRFLKNSINRQQERLRVSINWFPYPALISFILALLFTEVITMSLNPRLGNSADIMEISAPDADSGPIWLAVAAIGEKIVVTTSERQVFQWPLQPEDDDLESIERYLSERIRNEILTSSLSLTALPNQPRVVLACDLRLTYAHLRPILSVIARVGITNFSFETRIPAHAAQAEHPSSKEKAL
jgi:biopolymer transport protein ExbD